MSEWNICMTKMNGKNMTKKTETLFKTKWNKNYLKRNNEKNKNRKKNERSKHMKEKNLIRSYHTRAKTYVIRSQLRSVR
jgi:hypothetical protein